MYLINNFLTIIYNVAISLSLLVVLLYVIYINFKKIEGSKYKTLLLYITISHFVFGLCHYVFIFGKQVDANGYYNMPKSMSSWLSCFETDYGTGAEFIFFLIYPFTKFNVAFYNVFFVFLIIGLLGFYKLYILFIQNFTTNEFQLNWMVYFFFLLPTFHFFLAPLGKDVLIFYSLINVFISIKNNVFFHFKNIIFLIVILIIRPQVLLFLIAAYSIVVFFSNEMKGQYKIIGCIGFIAFIFPFVGYLKSNLGVNLFSFDSLNLLFNKLTKHGVKSVGVTSSVNMINSPFYAKMFAFSYLPMFWKANNLIQYLVSIENIVLAFLMGRFIFTKNKWQFFKLKPIFIKTMFVYSILSWIILSQTIYNLGLSSRQKYMYIPFLYMVIIIFFQERQGGFSSSKLN